MRERVLWADPEQDRLLQGSGDAPAEPLPPIDRVARDLSRAIGIAAASWERAHAGLPANPMTRTAAIPATGILAAALLGQLDEDDETLSRRVADAITAARRAWERTRRASPGNPIAATAERTVIGILAAGVLDRQRRSGPPVD